MSRKPGNSWRCPVCHNFVYDVMGKACNSCTDNMPAVLGAPPEAPEEVRIEKATRDIVERLNTITPIPNPDHIPGLESADTPRKNETKYKTFNVVEKDPRIAKVFHDSDGFWMWLNPGWTADPLGAHDIHEQSVTVTMEAFKRIVPCSCDECKGAGAPTIEPSSVEPVTPSIPEQEF